MAANLDNGVILGALGSAFTNTTGAITPPPGMVIATIQCIGVTKFKTLIAEDPNKTFNTALPAHQDNDGSAVAGYEAQDHGDGGIKLVAFGLSAPTEFPAGMTIYGRWTSVKIDSQASAGSSGGSQGIIVYFGY